MSAADAVKRVLVGRPFRSDRLSETLLPKRLALPVFASDALSSVAYAPNEVFLTLAVAGVSAYAFSWQIGLAVAVVMAVVVLSYRQNVHAYPSGGGDYEVATVNLGPRAGLTVASALLVDYVLTVAVSISSAAQYAASIVPAIRGHEAVVAVAAVVLLTAVNLRGLRESGTAFAIPTYVFMVAILGMAAVGTFRALTGDLPAAESAQFTTEVQPAFDGGLATLAGAFLLLRAFSSGCAALTGVEAISNGVPSFKKPKSTNAAITLAMLGGLAITMIMSILLLARQMGVVYVDEVRPEEELLLDGRLGEGIGNGTVTFADGTVYHQSPIITQLAHGIFDFAPPLVWLVTIATGLILVLAANTAFNGFPVLGSILAKDGYLPRQLHTRGDRLAFSNGILMLAGAAVVLIVAFDAEVSRLIQLYIVGVFVSFTMSQTGMIRHWTRELRLTTDTATRARMMRSRVINSVGLAMTATVLVVVLITKFLLGAWIAILAMVVLFVIMRAIRTHYDHVAAELDLARIDPGKVKALPSRVHAIVLVSKVHMPTMRALAYARATRPSTLEAITVDVDPEATVALKHRWEELDIPVPLKALHSPYREITRPILRYVKRIRRVSPRDLVVVYVPEYVVGHWWEQVLHNQSALRLKSALHFTPGVVVASVPWQLQSSIGAERRMSEMLPDDRDEEMDRPAPAVPREP
ncbi:APC family permease [Angustibacter speluncae]